MARDGRRGWPDRIRPASYTDLSAVGASDRQGPPRHQAKRPPGRAADQVRTRRQPKNRQGARADHPRILTPPRRRGDRINGTVCCHRMSLNVAHTVSQCGARPCPELGAKPTCRLNARTSHFDPSRTFRRRAFCHSTAIQAAAEMYGMQFRRAGTSAAGTALLNRYPCPSVHPLAFRYANCPAFSTPSAVVVKPNPFARPRMARTITWASLLSLRRDTKLRSILILSRRNESSWLSVE